MGLVCKMFASFLLVFVSVLAITESKPVGLSVHPVKPGSPKDQPLPGGFWGWPHVLSGSEHGHLIEELLATPTTKPPTKVPTAKPSTARPSLRPTPLPVPIPSIPTVCQAYSATNTNQNTQNYGTCQFTACPGQQFNVNGCDATCVGDQYLTLYDAFGNQVATNDDGGGSCGVCSMFAYTPPSSAACQTYTLREGCWSSSSCGGTIRVSSGSGVRCLKNIILVLINIIKNK